jgi:hypothetical protein
MPVEIHGKQYVTVAERVASFHESLDGEIRIDTEIVAEDEQYVTVKAIVWTTAQSCFTGHARSDKNDRSIEGQSPLEVAETSAIGRALGFAGFGLVEGIASADEVKAAQRPTDKKPKETVADTPAKAALRKLYALAKEKGFKDKDALRAHFQTDSLAVLAQHMAEPKDGCDMGHPHGLKDEAEGYRTMIRWLEAEPAQ